MHQRTWRTDPEVDLPPRSAHSIEQHSFQDHPDLHGRHPFESNDFVNEDISQYFQVKVSG